MVAEAFNGSRAKQDDKPDWKLAALAIKLKTGPFALRGLTVNENSPKGSTRNIMLLHFTGAELIGPVPKDLSQEEKLDFMIRQSNAFQLSKLAAELGVDANNLASIPSKEWGNFKGDFSRTGFSLAVALDNKAVAALGRIRDDFLKLIGRDNEIPGAQPAQDPTILAIKAIMTPLVKFANLTREDGAATTTSRDILIVEDTRAALPTIALDKDNPIAFIDNIIEAGQQQTISTVASILGVPVNAISVHAAKQRQLTGAHVALKLSPQALQSLKAKIEAHNKPQPKSGPA